MDKIGVLFVCMGNICRSPTAEGVFRKLINESNLDLKLEIDSAGTHAYHVGETPDARAINAALRRGIDISKQRARAVVKEDFNRFNYILAMDRSNLHELSNIQPKKISAEPSLLLDYSVGIDCNEVPDPYYGENSDFELVLDLLHQACNSFIGHLKKL
ncbi:MAG: low molecular weight protein-tyrosine-phosphatase [Pseudomonadota bacterium]|nr:low molecular weight protein-tyrosine-phosphatase [Pseudomonadota bacterium]